MVNDQLVTNFVEKANLFNEFFTQQCNTIENDSTLFIDLVVETIGRISSFDISKDEITKIIRYLDPNKAHEQDRISDFNFRYKRTNGSGIIYDVMNWLAYIWRCNLWNNSKTAGQIIYN